MGIIIQIFLATLWFSVVVGRGGAQSMWILGSVSDGLVSSVCASSLSLCAASYDFYSLIAWKLPFLIM